MLSGLGSKFKEGFVNAKVPTSANMKYPMKKGIVNICHQGLDTGLRRGLYYLTPPVELITENDLAELFGLR